MRILSNKLVIGLVTIIVGILVIIGLPEILRWVIGIILIVYGVLVLVGKK